MTDVVDDQERDDGDPAATERDRRERQVRKERQPASPDEPVADGPERAAERLTQSLDLVGRGAVVLGARGSTDREANEIGMRVEEMRSPRDRRTILTIRQVAQQRLLGDAHAHAEQALVVVRALHREEAQQSARERDFHRSHATPATTSSPAPRTVNAPARSGRASHASKRPRAVTSAARAASRSNPPAWTRSSARGFPDSSAAAALCTTREFTRRRTLIVRPPANPVTRPTRAPSPSPSTPAEEWAVATAATVAGPYSG